MRLLSLTQSSGCLGREPAARVRQPGDWGEPARGDGEEGSCWNRLPDAAISFTFTSNSIGWNQGDPVRLSLAFLDLDNRWRGWATSGGLPNPTHFQIGSDYRNQSRNRVKSTVEIICCQKIRLLRFIWAPERRITLMDIQLSFETSPWISMDFTCCDWSSSW